MKKEEGKEYAQKLLERMKQHESPQGFIAAFIEEGDEVQKSFLAQKEKVARQLGIELRTYTFPQGGNDEARVYVRKIVQAKKCKGALIQLPLKERNGQYLANVIPEGKDIDLLSARAYGGFAQGRWDILPPAVRVIQYILHKEKVNLTDFSSVAVIGQGRLIGKPISTWISSQVSECICLDKGYDPSVLSRPSLVISATGDTGSLDPRNLQKGAWVIDFGYGKKGSQLLGDLDTEKDISHLAYMTPTPGGTGPLLVTALFENFYVRNQISTYEDLIS